MDLRDYYDAHWTHVPEGGVDFTRLQYVIDHLEPGERVLDSGCGPGFLAAMIRDHGCDVTCIDVSRVGPERTRARGIEKAQQVDLDTDDPPFDEGSFDVVVANSNLEHLFYMHRHVGTLARYVRPGGKMIWLVPNIAHWRYRLALLFGRFPYIPESPTDTYHIRYMTAHDGRKLLEGAGLAEIRLRGHAGTWVRGLYPRLLVNKHTKRWFDPPYEALTRWRPSLFGRYLCFYARKPYEGGEKTV